MVFDNFKSQIQTFKLRVLSKWNKENKPLILFIIWFFALTLAKKLKQKVNNLIWLQKIWFSKLFGK